MTIVVVVVLDRLLRLTRAQLVNGVIGGTSTMQGRPHSSHLRSMGGMSTAMVKMRGGRMEGVSGALSHGWR